MAVRVGIEKASNHRPVRPTMSIGEHYRAQPFFYFFVAIICLIVLSPLVEQHLYGERLVRVLFTVMMATAVYAAAGQRKMMIVALVFAVPWLVMTWSGGGTHGETFGLLPQFLFVGFNIFLFALILYRVKCAPVVDLNILCGALSLYLLIAVNWAVSYSIIDALMPGSFDAGAAPVPWHKFLYFSLTTITTLGYGDILPTSAFARIWATLEAVTGVLYLAILVARLVSLYKN